MKILIAGGAGYVGSTLAPALLDHGYEVDVIDLLWFGNHLPDAVKVIEKDLFECVPSDLEGYDQVIFLGGLSNDPMADFDPAMNFVHNAALPSYLAYAANQAGVRRFIYASTCSVYGHTEFELFDETAPTPCTYPYGISKLQGERGVLQIDAPGFSAIALRFGTICGYSPRMRFDLIVNTMYKCAITDGKITVNNPTTWRPIVDVRDVAQAFVRAVQADEGRGGVYNISCDNFTVGQVADLVKEEVERLQSTKIYVDVKNVPEMRNYKVSCAKAKEYLGFRPQHGISEIVKSLDQRLSEFGDFSNPAYYNIQVFKQLRTGVSASTTT